MGGHRARHWVGSATLLTLGGILVFFSACQIQTAAERQLSTHLRSTFGMSLPCSLVWCDSYLDGGSMGGLIVDREADSLKWAWSALVPDLFSRARGADQHGARLEAWSDSVLSHTPHPVYIGIKYYRDAGGRPIGIGSPAESLFIQLLWYVVGSDSEFTHADYKRPRAASVARALQRQRARQPPIRLHRGDP